MQTPIGTPIGTRIGTPIGNACIDVCICTLHMNLRPHRLRLSNMTFICIYKYGIYMYDIYMYI